MRHVIIFFVCVLLFSCRQPGVVPVKDICYLPCTDPKVGIVLPDHSQAEADTVVIRIYADSSFTDLLNERMHFPDPLKQNFIDDIDLAANSYAYELYLPATNDTFRLYHVAVPMRHQDMDCREIDTHHCANYVEDVVARINGAPCRYEHWLMAEYSRPVALFRAQ